MSLIVSALSVVVPAFSTVTAGTLVSTAARHVRQVSFQAGGPESSFVADVWHQGESGALDPLSSDAESLISNLRGSYDAPPAPRMPFAICRAVPPPPVRLAARVTNQCCQPDAYVITAEYQ
jgi:hypothetical protein